MLLKKLLFSLSTTIFLFANSIPTTPGEYVATYHVTSSSARIAFIDKSNNEDGFNVYLYESNGNSLVKTITLPPSNGLGDYQYTTISGLKPSTLYHVEITAFNSKGESPSTISNSKNNGRFRTNPPTNYSLGDYLWLDSNHDAIQDSNESGINGTTVNLYNSTNCTGAIFRTTATTNGGGIPAKDGFYQFNNLNSGDYCLEFELDKNYLVSPHTDANSSGFVPNIHLIADDLDRDVGVYPKPIVNPNTFSLGDYFWLDSNHDGIQDSNESGINGTTVNLYDSDDCSGDILDSTTTANGGANSNDGFYQFNNLNSGNYCLEFELDTNYIVSPNTDANSSGFIPNIHLTADDLNKDIGVYPKPIVNPNTFSLGDYLWLDSNHDGIQDSNESGINGTTVNLYDSDDCSGDILDSTTTANGGANSNDGFYQFNNLNSGNYCLEFELDTNYLVSPHTDANSSGFIPNIHLTADDLDKDIGVYESTTTPIHNTFSILNNYIWSDSNKNGIQDNNESGINGLTVNLYNSLDCTGDIFNTTTTINGGLTNQDGFYQFTNLPTDNYCIEVVYPSNLAVTPNTNVNSSGQIQNIDLTSNISNQNIALFPKSVVENISTSKNCLCKTYKNQTVPLYSNSLLLVLIICLNSIIGIVLFRKEFNVRKI